MHLFDFILFFGSLYSTIFPTATDYPRCNEYETIRFHTFRFSIWPWAQMKESYNSSSKAQRKNIIHLD
jgi:hypothetical protein